MIVEIEITEDEVKGVMEHIGQDYNDLEARLQVEEHIAMGIKDHIDLRDWSLTDFFTNI